MVLQNDDILNVYNNENIYLTSLDLLKTLSLESDQEISEVIQKLLLYNPFGVQNDENAYNHITLCLRKTLNDEVKKETISAITSVFEVFDMFYSATIMNKSIGMDYKIVTNDLDVKSVKKFSQKSLKCMIGSFITYLKYRQSKINVEELITNTLIEIHNIKSQIMNLTMMIESINSMIETINSMSDSEAEDRNKKLESLYSQKNEAINKLTANIAKIKILTIKVEQYKHEYEIINDFNVHILPTLSNSSIKNINKISKACHLFLNDVMGFNQDTVKRVLLQEDNYIIAESLYIGLEVLDFANKGFKLAEMFHQYRKHDDSTYRKSFCRLNAGTAILTTAQLLKQISNLIFVDSELKAIKQAIVSKCYESISALIILLNKINKLNEVFHFHNKKFIEYKSRNVQGIVTSNEYLESKVQCLSTVQSLLEESSKLIEEYKKINNNIDIVTQLISKIDLSKH
ncbi:hypothetical protein AB837_00627 [bacterium AB1]|nr:hypothetical protein AB837_00627 [bacterium AB1]